MDRIISLLAALVGLIALGGAILVHTNADAERQKMATQIAALEASLDQLGRERPAASAPAAAQPDPSVTEALAALEARMTTLERKSSDEASQLAAANAALAARPAAAPPEVAVADAPAAAPSTAAPPSGIPAAIAADGPTTDCIPLGTRFMAAAGDSFPICKTRMVVKVAAVSDGLASINGAGEVAQGGTGKLQQGCIVAVFSADVTSGYAEMRVSCEPQ
ncbi:MAG TPA: hypothetical protein VHA07_08970 [Devosia sp.]|nr:hypothetical protein [Devosia sp.]